MWERGEREKENWGWEGTKEEKVKKVLFAGMKSLNMQAGIDFRPQMKKEDCPSSLPCISCPHPAPRTEIYG